MKGNQLFTRSRRRLTFYYGSTISVILSILAWGAYQAINHAHYFTIQRELDTVASTLHDALSPLLRVPAQIEAPIQQILPNLCLVGQDCLSFPNSHPYHLESIQTGQYYLALFSLKGNLIATTSRESQTLSLASDPYIISTEQGRYLKTVFLLHTQSGEDWGYLVVGRSLADFDQYLARVNWLFLFGLPLSLVLIAISAWWLTRLAMQPIYYSYQQIQQFTADAAHELRTPLAALRATVDTAILTGESPELLVTLNRQIQRLSKLVADLLILSRLDSSMNSFPEELVNIHDLIKDIIEEFTGLAINKDISLQYQGITSEGLAIQGNSEQLYRLLTNLVLNALEYTPQGGKVILSSRLWHQQVLIEVKDTGIGIAKEHQKHIFNRFYQVKHSRSVGSGGTGLGLAIAKAIALTHGGNLEVKSDQGKGSTFILRLPHLLS